MSSILVFDLNKRCLLFKLLSDELTNALLKEINKTNSNQEEQITSLNSDFLNSYFSPLVSSFEISREIDYLYEILSFNAYKSTIRYNLYENCLILCIFESENVTNSKVNCLLNDYQTSWEFKCIVSLIRYKCSICTIDSIDTNLIESMFKQWLKLNNNQIINFFEAIEFLIINDETKLRAELFIKEFFKFLNQKEDQYLTELEYQIDNDDLSIYTHSQTEIDEFLKDSHQITHGLLTYEDKVILKHRCDPTRNDDIDSSSLFMLLLEASYFVGSQAKPDEDDRQSFKSTQTSPEVKIESYQSALSYTPVDGNLSSQNITPISMQSNITSFLVDYKKTSCFLKTQSKVFNFYEILFIKLEENLCFILIKNSKLSKCCELITELNECLNEFNLITSKIRLNLNNFSENSDEDGQSSLNYSNEVKFLGYFINKLLNAYEKLKEFKTDFSNGQKNVKKVLEKRIDFIRNSINKRKSPKIFKQTSLKLTDDDKEVIFKQFTVLQNKINQIVTLTSNKATIDAFEMKFDANKMNDSINNLRKIEMQINLTKQTLRDLTTILFLSQNNYKTNASRGSSQMSDDFMHTVRHLFKKTNFIDYIPFIDIKAKRNISISYYWHLLPGLVHFALINRHDNLSFIPTIDTSTKFKCSSATINNTYRRYYPIIIQLLQKFDCSQFQFIDSNNKLIINYFIWFEDKNANYVPLDLNVKKSNENILKSNLPGITFNNYYDVLKKMSYPNAPINSLFCYELICIHSASLGEDKVKDQCEKLVEYLLPFRRVK